MVLVDTSVWIAHYRQPNAQLASILDRSLAYSHPVVVGELALGGLPNADAILDDFAVLPQTVVASHDETLMLIRGRDLANTGIGYADAQVLASTVLTQAAVLWTQDRRLASVADRLGVAMPRDF